MKRLFAAVGATALLGLGLVLAPPSAWAARHVTPSATLTPSEGLIDLQISHIAWQGLPASAPVYVAQCVAAPADPLKDCSFPKQPFPNTYVNSDENGTGNVPVQVHYGDLGTPDKGTITCTEDKACSIGLFQHSLDLASAILVPFTLYPPPEPCPPGKNQGSVQSQGAVGAFWSMLRWSGATCKLTPTLPVSYTLTDDVDGSNAFVAGSTDVAASAIPLGDKDVHTLHQAKRSFEYAPLSLSGLVFGYNLYDRVTRQQITNLKLTPRVITEILTGNVFSWNCPPAPQDCGANGGDPEIQALNPGVNFPANIQSFVPAGFSGQTWETTSWMRAVAPDLYKGGPQTIWGNTGIPATGSITPVTDPNILAQSVATPDGATYDVTGYIGLMDSTTASLFGLPTVALQVRGSQTDFVSPSASTISQALTQATVNDDGVTLTPDYTTKDPKAYPLPYLTYAILPGSYFSTSSPIPNSFQAIDGDVLKSFLTYAMSNKGRSLLPIGSFPLPATLKSETMDAIDRVGAVPVPGVHPSPSPSPSPSQSASPSPSPSPTDTTAPPPSGSGVTSGPTPTPTPTPTPAASPSRSPKPVPTSFAFPLASKQLSSPRTTVLVPLLAALAVLGILGGPLLLLGAKLGPAFAQAGSAVGGAFRRRRRPAAPGDIGDGAGPDGPEAE